MATRVLAAIGLIGAGVFLIASFSAELTTPPKPFLVPAGLILGGLGLTYLAVAIGVCSDNQFVTLMRRELSAYFVSPIGYLVLAGMILVEWYGYKKFYEILASVGRQQSAIPEPVVQYYFIALIPVIAVIMQIPAITMRLLAEEKRSGSLEVLLTSPVSETPIVLSKFLATWLFFMISWLPAGLFLVALRMEAGQPFDYRPLLSFYLCWQRPARCSSRWGCSSRRSANQIVSAVLTFAVMLLLLLCHWVREETTGFGETGRRFLARLSYVDLWFESLNGQLPIRDVLVWASAAVFGIFLSIKVLETRKWN